jgi:hypothetical protein
VVTNIKKLFRDITLIKPEIRLTANARELVIILCFLQSSDRALKLGRAKTVISSGHPLTPAFGLFHCPGSCAGKKIYLSKERQIISYYSIITGN